MRGARCTARAVTSAPIFTAGTHSDLGPYDEVSIEVGGSGSLAIQFFSQADVLVFPQVPPCALMQMYRCVDVICTPSTCDATFKVEST